MLDPMPVGRTHSISLLGMTGAVVEIEADISNQLPMFVLIGLPDAALNEAKDRVRSAITNSGLELPHRKVTINLSPAALPKHGSGFDLAIALAVLAAAGDVSAESIDRVAHLESWDSTAGSDRSTGAARGDGCRPRGLRHGDRANRQCG